MTKVDRETDLEDYVAYLSRLAEHLGLGQKPLHLLGFSQGGPTACRWLSSSDLNFDSQDLAQAQQETIADLGDEDEAELQAVIATQREQQRKSVRNNKRQKRPEDWHRKKRISVVRKKSEQRRNRQDTGQKGQREASG